jgi:hypothetical protein
MSDTTFKFDVGQCVRFGSQASIYEVYSRFAPDEGSEHQYYLKSTTTPSHLQWALESDLREVSDV